MKQHLRFLFLLATLISMVTINVHAYDAEIDGIYYNFNGDEAEVASKTYKLKGKVVIPSTVKFEGKTYRVTKIGKGAFIEGYHDITSIIIPNTVTFIGNMAFERCTGLTTINIPESVTSIGESAFKLCSKLTSIKLPNSITKIERETFYGCGITSITIPNTITFIGNGAFRNSNLESVNILSIESWLNITFEYGNPMEDAKKLLLNGEEIKKLVIPSSVKNVSQYAFAGCRGLQSITFHNAIETVEDGAFQGCGNLESVAIPSSVTTIGKRAFYGDTIQSLTIGSGVLEIGNEAFSSSSYSDYVSNIKKTIWLTNTPPENYKQAAGVINYVSNDQYKFSNPYSATVVYPQLSSMFTRDGIKYVVIDIPSLTCDAIDCVYDESAELTKLGTTVAYNANRTFKVLNVMPYTCCGNTFIKNVELGEGLPYIDDHVFDGCTNLQSVKLPETIAGLGISSFQDCASLTEIAIPSATSIVMYNAFKGCNSLQNVTMNDGTDPLTLAYNDDRLKINYNTNKVDLYNGAPLFEDCPLDYVYIGRNISYSAKQEAGYSPFYRNTSLRTVEITDQETEIGENEFYGCSGLKNVIIGNGVTTIGNWAFSGCSSLDFFEFGSSMQTIGTEAFSDCVNVTRIISHANTPPVCGSQALDDIQKTEFNGHPGCELYVPQGCEATYSVADQWSQFWLNMYEYDPTAIHGITTTTDVPAVFSLSGQRLAAPRKGINIIGGKKILMR